MRGPSFVAGLLALGVALSGVLVSTAAPAAAATCSETTKFVWDDSAADAAFGTRGAGYIYDNAPACQAFAATYFMRLSADYLNFIEVGTQQNASDGKVHFFPNGGITLVRPSLSITTRRAAWLAPEPRMFSSCRTARAPRGTSTSPTRQIRIPRTG